MKSNNLIKTNKNSKLALQKSKDLLKLTDKILDNKPKGPKWQFWLPDDNSLTRMQRMAINSEEPISIFAHDIFTKGMAWICFILRLHVLIGRNKKVLILTESELLRFIIKEKLSIESNNTICSLEIARKKLDNKIYDEVLVYDNYDIETLLYLKDRTLSLSLVNNDEISYRYFSNNNAFEFSEIILPTYEIFNFARNFIAKNSIFNDSNLLENLKKRNFGADKPFVWEVQSLMEEIETICDIIDENPINNIAIILPYENNDSLSVDNYYQAISKKYACSKYYDAIKIKQLFNIIITTYKYAADLSPIDYIILPQFDKVKNILDNENIFGAISTADTQLHIFQKENDYPSDLVEVIK